MSSQNAAVPTEASPASRSGAAAGSYEPVARPLQTGTAGSVSAGAENRRRSSPDLVVDDSDGSVRTDSGGTKRAGPSGGHPQLESLCGHTAEKRRRDGAGEEQEQLQASPPPDEEPSPFQRLSKEVQLLVFSHLSPSELCASVLPVCRQWYKLGRDPVLWQHLSFSGHRCSANTVVSILSFSTLLKTLTLNMWYDVELDTRNVALNRLLLQVAESCHRLRSLTVTHCKRINSPSLQAIVERCPLIERVEFKWSQFDSADCISALTGLQRLKALDFFCEPFDEAALLNVVRHCTRLQELSVPDMTDAGVRELVAHAGDRLLSLRLYARQLTDAGYRALGGCRKLQTLIIWRPYKMTDVGLPALAGLHDLRRLEIWWGYQLSAAALARLFAGQNMPQLMELNLYGCRDVDDATVDSLTANCTQLTVLDLSECSKITRTGLKLIGTRLHCLRELNLSECGNVDDTTVDTLTANCPRLTVLDLSECSEITDTGLEMIVTRLHCLRELTLYGVPGITEELIPERLRQP